MPMGKRACGIMCFAAMAAVFVAQAAKESLSFHGTTDKDPIAYACGEEMVFTVTLVDRNAKNAPVAGRRIAWTLDGDDGSHRAGEDPLADGAYHENMWTNVMQGYCWRNNGAKTANEPYLMVMRDVRAVAFAKTLPQWDGRTLKVGGGSMGGYRSIALAALDPDVSHCSPSFAWLCDLAGRPVLGRIGGWFPLWTPELAYVDGVNFAMRVKCPVDMMFGLADYVCPPSGQMVLYRNLRGPVRRTWLRIRCEQSGLDAREAGGGRCSGRVRPVGWLAFGTAARGDGAGRHPLWRRRDTMARPARQPPRRRTRAPPLAVCLSTSSVGVS